MMATEQDHVWAMLDDMLVFLAKRHVPTPERTYKLDGGWTLAMEDLRRFVDQLTTERDQLRAELAAAKETAAISTEIASARIYQNEKQIRIHFANTREWKEALDAAKARAEAAEAHAEELRAAALAVVERWDSPAWKDLPHTGEYIATLRAALSVTPAQSLSLVKAAALRGVEALLMDSVRNGRIIAWMDAVAIIRGEADRLDAKAGMPTSGRGQCGQ